jgi:hypothetical protein
MLVPNFEKDSILVLAGILKYPPNTGIDIWTYTSHPGIGDLKNDWTSLGLVLGPFGNSHPSLVLILGPRLNIAWYEAGTNIMLVWL